MFLLIICLLVIGTIASCNKTDNKGEDNESNDPGITSETKLELNYSEVAIYVGERITIVASLSPTTNVLYSATWTTDNAQVATVVGGVVIGISVGKANITVSIGNLTKVVEVEVIEKIDETYVSTTGVTLEATKTELEVNETAYLVATVTPSNATIKEVSYTSSDNSILSIDATGKMTGLKEGTVIIKAETKEVSSTIEIKVKAKDINNECEVIIDKTSLTIGEKVELTITNPTTNEVNYTMSEAGIISLSNNEITGLKAGTTELIVTIGSYTYTTKIIVSEITNFNPIIVMKNTEIEVAYNNGGVEVINNIIKITLPGSYEFYGTLDDGQIMVSVTKDDKVYLYLNGVEITSSTSAAINSTSSDKTFIIVGTGTVNKLKDASSYQYNGSETEPNACLFSKDDLTIKGEGTLIVEGNYNNGIGTKDDLKVNGTNLVVMAINNAVKGNESIELKSATLTLSSSSDCLKSEETEEDGKGYINIDSCNISIVAVNDGIQAATSLYIINSKINITTGKGSSGTITSTSSSMKGIKATTDLIISGGEYVINSNDDAIHSNSMVTINGGNFIISSGDGGIHADDTLTINMGTINITKSYEGLEALNIIINDGNIHVVASDDGINAAGGDGSSTAPTRPGFPGSFGGGMTAGNGLITINGGYVFVNANGDGLDANGSIKMTGGLVIVNGPTSNGNGALDYDNTFVMTGGELIATGSSGMMQAVSNTSTLYCLKAAFTSHTASTIICIKDQSGNEIVTFAPCKTYQSIVYCSSKLVKGSSYQIYFGGSYTGGDSTDGLSTGGTYNGGTKTYSFTVSQIVTTVGSSTQR